MTNEKRTELIKHLKYTRSIGADYLITNEDVDEIIKALEQQPCEDCISRANVLALAEKGILVSNGNYQAVCKAINDLPSVQPQRGDRDESIL